MAYIVNAYPKAEVLTTILGAAKLQILQFMKQSREGGQSLFSDSFKAVSTLVERSCDLGNTELKTTSDLQSAVAALTQFLQPYHYRNNGHWLHSEHHTIAIDESAPTFDWTQWKPRVVGWENFDKTLQAVRWSPPFRGPMLSNQNKVTAPLLDSWISGARMLKREFERPEAIFETRMEEGTCVIFDNWRILHGRRAFASGERWLRGAYIDNATFRQQVLKLDRDQS